MLSCLLLLSVQDRAPSAAFPSTPDTETDRVVTHSSVALENKNTRIWFDGPSYVDEMFVGVGFLQGVEDLDDSKASVLLADQVR